MVTVFVSLFAYLLICVFHYIWAICIYISSQTLRLVAMDNFYFLSVVSSESISLYFLFGGHFESSCCPDNKEIHFLLLWKAIR